MKVSRRTLVQVLSAAVAGTSVEAQAPPGAIPASADAELEGARQYSKLAVSILRQVPLPISTEPATRFIPRS